MSSIKTPAVLFVAVDRPEIHRVEVPEPLDGQVLIRNLFTTISPGTELRCLAGLQPDSEPWGYIPGYVSVGTVERAGSGAENLIGKTFLYGGTTEASVPRMWGAHLGWSLQEPANLFDLNGVEAKYVGLAKLGAIALRGVCAAKPQPGERVAVLGLGPIGQWSARLFAQTGALVTAFDLEESRLEIARSGGIDAQPAPERPIADFDIVVESTGSLKVAHQAYAWLRPVPWSGAPEPGSRRILIQASYPADFALPYQELFIAEAAVLLPRDQTPRELKQVIQLMADGKVSYRELLTDAVPYAEAPKAYARLRDREPGAMTYAIDWRS